MTIVYPLTPPAAPGFRAVKITRNSVVAATASPFTGAQTIQTHPGEIWTAALTLPKMKRAAAGPWRGFLLALNGMQGTFLLGDPTEAAPLGSAAGTPVVDGAGQTGKVLATRGWTASQSGVLLAGDRIQIGSGLTARLYEIAADASADGAGLASLDIWPRLRESPADGAGVVTANAQGLFRLTGNDDGWDKNEALFYGISLAAVEAI
jgi:hypothetical protein